MGGTAGRRRSTSRERVPAIGIAILALLTGCDVPPDPRDRPAAPWLSSSPADGATGVDRLAPIVLRWDRPILPSSIPVATVRLGSGERRFRIAVRADPLEPGIVVRPVRPLPAGVRFLLEVDGLEDLDGEPVEPAAISFVTGEAATPEPAPPGFAEVEPIFARSCAPCHRGPSAPLGLDLSSAAGIEATAIGVPAAELRGQPGPEARPAPGLGGLARIAAAAGSGSPETSYLVYKLLGDPHVVGQPMPPAGPSLPAADLRLLADWIAAGAPR